MTILSLKMKSGDPSLSFILKKMLKMGIFDWKSDIKTSKIGLFVVQLEIAIFRLIL